MINLHSDAMQALVNLSPAAVAVHDKHSWLALFAHRYTVEDPVGSSPVCPAQSETFAPLERFYETFIAPNSIRFEVFQDYYGPDCVVRNLSIHITMAPNVCVTVPMHLFYQLMEENGSLKIVRLAAHWELVPMVLQLFRIGLPAISVMMNLSGRMFLNMGFNGMIGFAQAALTPRKRRYHALKTLITAINCQDIDSVKHCFTNGKMAITNGFGQALPLASLTGIVIDKKIAAGTWISASIRTSSGNCLLMAETCRSTGRLLSCTIYA